MTVGLFGRGGGRALGSIMIGRRCLCPALNPQETAYAVSARIGVRSTCTELNYDGTKNLFQLSDSCLGVFLVFLFYYFYLSSFKTLIVDLIYKRESVCVFEEKKRVENSPGN